MLLKLRKFLLMAISILSLTGCGSLNKIQAKQIEEKLSEMYDGEKFEVFPLGNRFGTLTNDTVTAHVKEVNSGVVFTVEMNTKGEIVINTYLGSAVINQLENLLIKNLEEEGITADILLNGFRVGSISNLNPDMPLSEYISKTSPEFFFGHLIIKESSNNTGGIFY